MSENQEKGWSNTMCKIPTAQLQKRYGISRSVAYSRLQALSIKPVREGGRSYVTAEQLQLADDLNTHMAGGGKMDEFVLMCQASGRIVVLEETATGTAIVPQTQNRVSASQFQGSAATTTEETTIRSEASKQDMIANLQAQKGERVQLEDIQEVHERAQQRAFAKAAAEETLTLIYEATEEFTIPGLKEQLNQHRTDCKQARAKRTGAHNVNDFLSKSLALYRMTGTNGSTGSPTSSNSQ